MHKVNTRNNKDELIKENSFLRQRVAELEETEDRYRTLIELGNKIGEAVLMLQDIDGREGMHTYVSDQWPKITGYSREELLSMSFFDLVSSRDKKISMQRHRKKMSGKTIPDLFELTIIRKDGKEAPIEITSAATNYEGKPTNVVYIRDIGERKKAEEEIKQYRQHLEELVKERSNEAICQMNEHKHTKEQLQFILDSLPAYVWYKDKEGRYVYINKGAEGGFSKEKWIGKKLNNVKALMNTGYPAKERHALDMRQIISGEDMINKVDHVNNIWLSTSRIPHKNKNGEVIGLVGLSMDITAMKETEEKISKLLEHEKKIKQQLENEIQNRIYFTRTLAHEMKTPLTPIRAASEILMIKLENEDMRSLAQNINKGALTLDNRISELFDLSKSEIGMLKLNLIKVDPAKLIEQAIKLITTEASKKDIVLSIDIPYRLNSIYLDEERILQVILNLLNNAVKFTPSGGFITLRATSNNRSLTVEVIDTGKGIPVKDRKYLFQPYFKVDDKNDNLSGMGLGLALCKSLIELHQGKIWLTSKPGKGSTFSFSIPFKNSVENLTEL